MVKIRVRGLPEDIERFVNKLKKDGRRILQGASERYPDINSEYVRVYLEIAVDKEG